MASVVLSSVGSSLGNYLLPGIGGRVLGYLGRKAGKSLDENWGLSAKSSSEGAHLENLRVQDSAYGSGIPLTFGQVRVAGNYIWASDLIETKTETSNSGGKGGLSATTTSYSYSIHCAIALALGEIGGIQTIWADGDVIYADGAWTSAYADSLSIYLGTYTQEPDPLMESFIGTNGVPAYRGIAYVVLDNFQLADFGSRLPNLTFEIIPKDSDCAPVVLNTVAPSPSLYSKPNALNGSTFAPIVIEGSASRARQVLVGGFSAYTGTTAFSVIRYDVTDDAPVVVESALSATFLASNIIESGWALAPDKRYVAMMLIDNGASPSHKVAIYDSQTNAFGAALGLSLGTSDTQKQLVWIDAQHFILPDYSGTARGVRVLARSGLSVVDLGFFDAWGAGSLTGYKLLSHMQFAPVSGGFLYFSVIYNTSSNISIYARPIHFMNNALVVGGVFTVASNLALGNGTGLASLLVKSGDDEYTFFYGTTVDMRLVSFSLTTTASAITRPWQTLTNAISRTATAYHLVRYGNKMVVIQASSGMSKYELSEIALGDGSFSLVTDRALLTNSPTPTPYVGATKLDGSRFLMEGLTGSYYQMTRLSIVRRRLTGDTLDAVVGKILECVGYNNTDYDVTALEDESVDGYILDAPMTAAAAIAPLQYLKPFDLVESGDRIKAVLHKNSADIILDASEAQPHYDETRLQELDLPVQICVNTLDASRDYETGSQRARRQATRGARSFATLSLPLVCTPSKAKQIAEEQLYVAWAERESCVLRFSRRALALEPGDILSFNNRLLRAVSVNLDKGVVEVAGVFVPESAVARLSSADGGMGGNALQNEIVETQLYLMDLPLLRSDDNEAGIYAAMSGLSGWRGGSLWRSSDDANFTVVGTFSAAATAGIATSVLPDGQSYYLDQANAVYVQLLQGALSSCSDDDLLNGANAALLGDELIQFKTAQLVASGLYLVSGLLRGRRGTESATTAHALGERFVLLNDKTVQFFPVSLSDRAQSYYFRAASNGQTVGSAATEPFTYALATLCPFAPVHIAGSRASGTGSDLTLTWIRRARLNAQWVDYIDVPLDEASELYEIDIFDGSTVVRTVTALTNASYVYTAAQQASDWTTIPSSFSVSVYQRSARYGRGKAGTETI